MNAAAGSKVEIAAQLDQLVKKQLEREKELRPNSLGVEVSTAGVEAHVQRDFPRQWSITAYVKKLWAGSWFGGARAEKKF